MVKSEILKTAGELFLKYGLRSVSIDDICNEMHISKKTFYVHFKQKDELVECLLTSIRDNEIRNQNELLLSDNIVTTVLVNYKNILKNFNVDKHLAFFYDLEKYYPKLMSIHNKEKNQNLENNVKSVLKLGIEQGFFRTDINIDMMSNFLVQSFLAFVSDLKADSTPYRKKIDFIMETFFRLVSTPKGLECYFENIK